jgi:hypothetical protein
VVSRPAQGQDATFSFGMKRPVSLPFLPYRRVRAIACGIGPSLQKRKVWAVHRVFVMNFSFDFDQLLFCFLPRLVLGSLRVRLGAGDSSFYTSIVEDGDADVGNG